MNAGGRSLELSVGVVSYNRVALLERCLETVYRACEGLSHEIIVVDNASTDGTTEAIRDRHPRVRLIRNGRNAGLTRGVNQVVEAARGGHVLILDNDTEVDHAAIRRLLEFQRAHPDVGAVGPKLMYPNGTEQGAAKAFPTPMAALFGRRSLLRRWFPNNRFSRRYLISAYATTDEPYEVDSISAAAILVRRESMDQAGGMDERFFVYWSDVDWCRRLKAHGWRLYIVPSARVIHLESRTLAKVRPRAIIDFHKGAYRYYCLHHARFPLHPMRGVAFVGLSIRAGLLLAANALRRAPAPARAQGRP